MQQFNIDISQPRGPLVIYASQADSYSRFFSVTVTDNGAAYAPPAGSIFTVRFGAPGLPAGWYDTITEQGGGTHPAVVLDENTLTVELAEQALSAPGTNKVVVIVSDAEGYNLASWAFELQVEAVPGYDAPEATVYYNALTEQVAQTLANAQAAAESAAEAATSAAEAAASAASIDPSTLVKEVNGETPVAGAVSVTTRNLAYQVGDTITTADGSFDPNTAIGGTWTRKTNYVGDGVLTSIEFTGATATSAYYVIRNGVCYATFNRLFSEAGGKIADLPKAITTFYTMLQGTAASVVYVTSGGALYCPAGAADELFNLVYPVASSELIPKYVWTKTA